MLRRTILRLSVVATTTTGWAQRPRGRRIRPPQGLPCSPDHLTSLIGEVKSYSRTSRNVKLAIRTDWNSEESAEVRWTTAAKEAQDYFLLNGEPFKVEDFEKIETKPGKLKNGMRAIVWVCEGGHQPVIDWRPPPAQRPPRAPGKQ